MNTDKIFCLYPCSFAFICGFSYHFSAARVVLLAFSIRTAPAIAFPVYTAHHAGPAYGYFIDRPLSPENQARDKGLAACVELSQCRCRGFFCLGVQLALADLA